LAPAHDALGTAVALVERRLVVLWKTALLRFVFAGFWQPTGTKSARIEPLTEPQTSRSSAQGTAVAVAACAAVGVWSFWPTLQALVACWLTEPDYSHGLLTPFIVAAVLYWRRDVFPASLAPHHVWGLSLIAASVALRALGGVLFLDALDNWSLILWLAGMLSLVGGPSLIRWTLPALGFLLLAMPLPFQLEHLSSSPLQRGAVLGSTWILQTLGLPAFAEGSTIILDQHRLEVARACAGLRIFMGMLALALVWSLASKQPGIQRWLLFAAAIPVAVVANIARIVLTGFCLMYLPESLAQRLVHDAAGWLMIPLAIGLLALAQAWLSRVIVLDEVGAAPAAQKHGLSFR
jgi:exosortase